MRSVIDIDPSLIELHYLREIIKNNHEYAIQIYFQLETKYCYFFVSDERGSIIFFRKEANFFYEYLTRLYVFAGNVAENVISNNPMSPLKGGSNRVEVYRLERDINHNCAINEINPELDNNIIQIKKRIVPISLSLHLLENGDIGYRFSLPDGGFSEIFSAGQINGIVRELKVLMGSVMGYNYVVTDVNLDHMGLSLYSDYSSFALSEKNRFELLVERGI